MEGVNRSWRLLWEDMRVVKGGNPGEERGVWSEWRNRGWLGEVPVICSRTASLLLPPHLWLTSGTWHLFPCPCWGNVWSTLPNAGIGDTLALPSPPVTSGIVGRILISVSVTGKNKSVTEGVSARGTGKHRLGKIAFGKVERELGRSHTGLPWLQWRLGFSRSWLLSTSKPRGSLRLAACLVAGATRQSSLHEILFGSWRAALRNNS